MNFRKIGWHADTTPMYRELATFFKGDTGDTRLTHPVSHTEFFSMLYKQEACLKLWILSRIQSSRGTYWCSCATFPFNSLENSLLRVLCLTGKALSPSFKCVNLVSPVSPLKKAANALYIGVVSACQPIFQKIIYTIKKINIFYDYPNDPKGVAAQ